MAPRFAASPCSGYDPKIGVVHRMHANLCEFVLSVCVSWLGVDPEASRV